MGRDNKTEQYEHDGLITVLLRPYLWGVTESLSYEDLMQAGRLACERAKVDFDPALGKFSTHARGWIRAYILREIQNHSRTIRIPVNQWEKGRRSAPLPPPCQRADRIVHEFSGATATWLDGVASAAPSPEEQVQDSEQADSIHQALQVLTADELAVIKALYFKDQDRAQTAQQIFGSRKMSPLDDLEAGALAKLRAELENTDE